MVAFPNGGAAAIFGADGDGTNPSKTEISTWGTEVEDRINAIGITPDSYGITVYDTIAAAAAAEADMDASARSAYQALVESMFDNEGILYLTGFVLVFDECIVNPRLKIVGGRAYDDCGFVLTGNFNMAAQCFLRPTNGNPIQAEGFHVWCVQPSEVIAATAMAGSTAYRIESVGTTDYTLVGAPSNTVGVVFTATGAGTGTGTVSQGMATISGTNIAATLAVAGTTYRITTVGTTDYTAIGAVANTVGLTFTATAAGTGTGTVSVWNPRAQLRQYPPIFDISRASGSSIKRVRMSSCYDGIYARGIGASGNPGAVELDDLEIGCFGTGIDFDGNLHFSAVGNLDFWYWGFATNSVLLDINADGTTNGFVGGGGGGSLDGLSIKALQGFKVKHTLATSGTIPIQVDTVSLDGDRGRLILGAGTCQIGKVYATETQGRGRMANQINVTAGRHKIADIHIPSSDAVNSVEVQGAAELYVGQAHIANFNNAARGIYVRSTGHCHVDHLVADWAAGSRTEDFVETVSGGSFSVGKIEEGPTVDTAGAMVRFGSDEPKNFIWVQQARPNSIALPATRYEGFYGDKLPQQFPTLATMAAAEAANYLSYMSDGLVVTANGADFRRKAGASVFTSPVAIPNFEPKDALTPYHMQDGVGQGTAATDVAACQAALDTGYHVDMTPRPGEQFEINACLESGGAGQRIYTRTPEGGWGGAKGTFLLEGGGDFATTVLATLLIPGESYTILTAGTTDFTTVGAADSNPGTVFTATGPATGTGTVTVDAAIRIKHTKVHIDNIAFEESTASAPGSPFCVYAQLDANTDDLDATVTRCNFYGDNLAMAMFVGRGAKFTDNIGNSNIGIKVAWPSGGIVDGGDQDQPEGHRALVITDNRFHGTGATGPIVLLSANSDDILRGAIISRNTVDIGSRLLDADIEMRFCIISDNVVEFANQNSRFRKAILGCVIANNVVNGLEADLASSPFAAFSFEGAVDGCTIDGNAFANIDARALWFQADLRNSVITGNAFNNIGQDGSSNRGPIAFLNAWNVDISGNTATRCWTNFIVALGGASSTTTYWKDVTISGNKHDAVNVLSHALGSTYVVNVGGNSVQSAVTTATNAQTGTSYVLAASDASDLVTMNNASANTVTLPLNATVAIGTGTWVEIKQIGAGQTTIDVESSGVTLNGVADGSCTIDARQNKVFVYKDATDAWIIDGPHGAVA